MNQKEKKIIYSNVIFAGSLFMQFPLLCKKGCTHFKFVRWGESHRTIILYHTWHCWKDET